MIRMAVGDVLACGARSASARMGQEGARDCASVGGLLFAPSVWTFSSDLRMDLRTDPTHRPSV